MKQSAKAAADTLPTRNLESERAVIACLIGNPDPALILKNHIDADLFTDPAIRECFSAICAHLVDGDPVDAVILSAALSSAAYAELTSLPGAGIPATRLPAYVRILKRCAVNRETEQARNWLSEAIANRRPVSEIRAITDSLERLERGQQQKKTRIVSIEDFCRLPPAETWLVKGHFEADSMALIFGESGTYKSFLAIDLAGHVATGKPWRGMRTRKGLAIYVAGEGANGLRSRFKAWFDYHGEPAGNVAVLTVQQSLCEPGGVQALVDEIQTYLDESGRTDKPLLITLDTLATNYGNGDENSTKDMNAFVSALRTIRETFECCVLVVHHSGHTAKERGRGSSALHSGLDWVYRIERHDPEGNPDSGNQNSNDYPDDDRMITVLTCCKAKDAAQPLPLAFKVNPVALPWVNSDGERLSSCVLTPTDLPASFQPTGKAKAKPITGKAKAALALLETLYSERRKMLADTGHDPEKAAVTVADWLSAMQSIEAYKQNRTRIIRTLEERKIITVADGFVSLVIR